MSDFVLRLPPITAIEHVMDTDHRTKDQILRSLLEDLWVHEADLPDEIKHTIRGKVAAAKFANDPITQLRRAEAMRTLKAASA